MTQPELLIQFLKAWPLQRIQKMTLEEYVLGNSNYKDTFCYWVETKMQNLGNIKGVSGGGSFKFGIFYKNTDKEYKDTQYREDGTYAWVRKYGSDRNSAFEQIKKLILEVIQSTQTGNFEAIDKIELFNLFKWKIAFLYSGYRLTPIYKKEWLEKIAVGLNVKADHNSIASLQFAIVSSKPQNIEFYKWYRSLLDRFIFGKQFFVIGTKYRNDGTGEYESIMNDLLNRGVVSIGFNYDHSLKRLFNKKSEAEIEKYLNENAKGQAKDAIRKFLKIKVGDIIALKKYGTPTDLCISAYAKVCTNENDEVYGYDPGVDGLGHYVHVTFLERDVDLHLELSKTKTIHLIDDTEEIDAIFGEFKNPPDASSADSNPESGRSGTSKKNTSGHKRKVSYEVWIKNVHNKLQQALHDKLKTEYRESCEVLMEKDFVDVRVEFSDRIDIYEIKPFRNPLKCIRESIGQLTYYASKQNASKKIRLIAVGPEGHDSQSQQYIDFLGHQLKMDLQYLQFSWS